MKMLRLALLAGVALGNAVLSVAADAPVPPSFTRTIYLVRHGQYEIDQPGDEKVAKGLTPLGIAQAKLIAARLRGMPVDFTSLTASPLTRARQTAAVVHEALPQLPVKIEPLLEECTPRTWQVAVTKELTPAELAAAEAQLNEAFARYFVPATGADQHDILVCHGNVTRYFVTKALGVDPQAWLNLSVAHCSLTIIQVRPDGSCKVLAVGDTGHLPSNLVSGLTRVDAQLKVPGVQ